MWPNLENITLHDLITSETVLMLRKSLMFPWYIIGLTGSFHLSYKFWIRHKTMLTHRYLFPSQEKKDQAPAHTLWLLIPVSVSVTVSNSATACKSLTITAKLNNHNQSKLLPIRALWCHSLGEENNQYLRKWNWTNELDVFTLEIKRIQGKHVSPLQIYSVLKEEVQFALCKEQDKHMRSVGRHIFVQYEEEAYKHASRNQTFQLRNCSNKCKPGIDLWINCLFRFLLCQRYWETVSCRINY